MKVKDISLKIIKEDIAKIETDAVVKETSHQFGMMIEIIDDKKKQKKKKGNEIIEVNTSGTSTIFWTKAKKGKTKYEIHVPAMQNDSNTAEEEIRTSFAGALQCAGDLNIQSIAFPGLGCSMLKFPTVGAAKIMIQEYIKFARKNKGVKKIYICVSDKEVYSKYKKTAESYLSHIIDGLGFGPYVTVDAIIEYKEGIVLIERSNPPYGWALPGGFVDSNESLEDAVARESLEETNLKLVNLRQMHTYSDPSRDQRFHTVTTVFIAEGRGRAKFGDDAKGLKVVPYKELLKLEYAFDHKKVVRDYLKKYRKKI